MKAKLQEEMKAALKAKEKVKLETIRGLLTAFQYERLQKKVDELADKDCVAVIQRELKKRKESLEFAKKDGRQELIERGEQEIAVLQSYLPAQLSAEQLEAFFAKLKSDNADTNLGQAMKALKEAHGGQYDGKLASDIAKKLLT